MLQDHSNLLQQPQLPGDEYCHLGESKTKQAIAKGMLSGYAAKPRSTLDFCSVPLFTSSAFRAVLGKTTGTGNREHLSKPFTEKVRTFCVRAAHGSDGRITGLATGPSPTWSYSGTILACAALICTQGGPALQSLS